MNDTQHKSHSRPTRPPQPKTHRDWWIGHIPEPPAIKYPNKPHGWHDEDDIDLVQESLDWDAGTEVQDQCKQ